MPADRPQQRFFRELGAFFKTASDPDADDERRTGARAGFPHCRQDRFADAVGALRRLQHIQPAHVFTADAFRRDRNLKTVPGNHMIMNDGRCIVAGIGPPQRIGDDGFAQIACGVAVRDARVDRFFQGSSDKVYFLPDRHKDDGKARILTDRRTGSTRDVRVLHKLAEDIAADR